MKPVLPAAVDLRGFDTHLVALEAVRAAELEGARGAIARAKRLERTLEQEVRKLEGLEAQESRSALAAQFRACSVADHARALGYLVSLARQRALRELAWADARAGAAQAIAHGVNKERSLAVVQRLRQEALRRHALSVQRRLRKGADDEWLARQPARLNGSEGEEA